MAVFAENLDGKLVVRQPCLGVVELQEFMAACEEHLVLVEEGRPGVIMPLEKRLPCCVSQSAADGTSNMVSSLQHCFQCRNQVTHAEVPQILSSHGQ